MKLGEPKYFRRFWILLVLRAATLSGSATISSDLFHRLVYFVNALMPVVGLQSETARVLKASYGPFFPEYQWDLDRLVGNGLISVANLEWVSEDQRFFGKYRITSKGITFVVGVAASTSYFSEVERAISEIVSAFISTPSALSAPASHLDANFGQDTIRDGEIVDFGEWQTDNFSTNAAEFLFDSWLANLAKDGVNAKVASTTLPEVIPHDVKQTDSIGIAGDGFVVQGTLPAYKPLSTPNQQHKRAFHLYAHYLVQSLGHVVQPITARA